MTRLVSWNVNGIRAVVKKDFINSLDKLSPTILCLQETKASLDQFPGAVTALKWDIISSDAVKKGYSGVATMSKVAGHHLNHIERDEFDNEGRVIISEYKPFVLINGYFPNGQRDHGRVPYKLSFYESILDLVESYKSMGKEVIVTGDFNTAHKEIDLANPKSNRDTTGFLPIEREWMDHYVSHGLTDAYRFIHGNKEGEYTWWTYRNNCRQRNIGWRIDYFMVTEGLLPFIKDCTHNQEIMGSDHCPLTLELSDELRF